MTRQCLVAHAGSGGSFVRLEKLKQTACAGASVLQGLRARYQGAASEANASQSGLVGERAVWEHQSQIQLLTKASLSGDAVSSPVRQNDAMAARCSSTPTCHLLNYAVLDSVPVL